MVMSVEIDKPEDVMEEGHVVHLFAGTEDLDYLIALLESLRDDVITSNRLTFFSEEWGNGDLSTDRALEDGQISHCLKITKFDR